MYFLKLINHHRFFFLFHYYNWGKNHPKKMYLSFGILFLPVLDFRIGNGNTWFWIRNEQLHHFLMIRKQKNIKF